MGAECEWSRKQWSYEDQHWPESQRGGRAGRRTELSRISAKITQELLSQCEGGRCRATEVWNDRGREFGVAK